MVKIAWNLGIRVTDFLMHLCSLMLGRAEICWRMGTKERKHNGLGGPSVKAVQLSLLPKLFLPGFSPLCGQVCAILVYVFWVNLRSTCGLSRQKGQDKITSRPNQETSATWKKKVWMIPPGSEAEFGAAAPSQPQWLICTQKTEGLHFFSELGRSWNVSECEVTQEWEPPGCGKSSLCKMLINGTQEKGNEDSSVQSDGANYCTGTGTLDGGGVAVWIFLGFHINVRVWFLVNRNTPSFKVLF